MSGQAMFFSSENFEKLYSNIRETVSYRFNYNIGEKMRESVQNVMNMVYAQKTQEQPEIANNPAAINMLNNQVMDVVQKQFYDATRGQANLPTRRGERPAPGSQPPPAPPTNLHRPQQLEPETEHATVDEIQRQYLRTLRMSNGATNTRYYVINSRWRNMAESPNAADFTVVFGPQATAEDFSFPDRLRNVVRISVPSVIVRIAVVPYLILQTEWGKLQLVPEREFGGFTYYRGVGHFLVEMNPANHLEKLDLTLRRSSGRYYHDGDFCSVAQIRGSPSATELIVPKSTMPFPPQVGSRLYLRYKHATAEVDLLDLDTTAVVFNNRSEMPELGEGQLFLRAPVSFRDVIEVETQSQLVLRYRRLHGEPVSTWFTVVRVAEGGVVVGQGDFDPTDIIIIGLGVARSNPAGFQSDNPAAIHYKEGHVITELYGTEQEDQENYHLKVAVPFPSLPQRAQALYQSGDLFFVSDESQIVYTLAIETMD